MNNTLPEEASECAGCFGGISGSNTDWETSSAGQRKETLKRKVLIVGVYFLFNISNIYFLFNSINKRLN